MRSRNVTTYVKLFLDLVLLILLALMYRKNVISMDFHETGGLVLVGLFVLHKALNWRFIRGITAGIVRRRAKVRAGWIVDVLLLLSVAAVLVTGLLIAKTLPTAIAQGRWLRPWHEFSAALALVLAGVHLWLHAPLLRSALWSKLPLPGRIRTAVGTLLLCAVLAFGAYSLVRTEFLSLLSQPAVSSFTVEAPEHDSPPGGEERHPGGGRQNGKGSGGGKGLGLGRKQPPAEDHIASPSHVLQTMLSYASILAFFAVLTALIRTAAGRKKQQEGLSP